MRPNPFNEWRDPIGLAGKYYIALCGPDGAYAPETRMPVACGINSRGEIAPASRDDLWFIVRWTDRGYRAYGWAETLPEGARIPAAPVTPFFAQIG